MRPHRASNMFRSELCPPSPWVELEIPDTESPIADEGRLIHRAIPLAFTQGDYSECETEDQRYAVESCVRFLERVLKPYQDAGVKVRIEFEKTMPVLDSDGLEIVDRYVTADVLIFPAPGVVILIDWKTGFLASHVAALHDRQLQTYAVGVRNNHRGISKVIAHRYHPRIYDVTRESQAVFEGDEAYWSTLAGELQSIVANSTPDAERVAGAVQCRYCKFNAVCPEFVEWSKIANADEDAIHAVEVVNGSYPLKQLGVALGVIQANEEKLRILRNQIEKVKALAIEALEGGATLALPDGSRLALKPGNNQRKIPDVMKAKDAFSEISPRAFLRACTVSVSDLESVYRAETGLKGKAAKTKFNDQLRAAGALVEKRNRPAIVPLVCAECSDPIRINEKTETDVKGREVHASCYVAPVEVEQIAE